MLILQTLTVQSMSGYAIVQHIERLPGEVASPTGRRARRDTVMASGRRKLGAEIPSFDHRPEGIQRVLHRA